MDILEQHKVDFVTSDFPVSFSTLFTENWLFVAYYNKDRHLTVAAQNQMDKAWTYKILPTKVGWDTHNYIAMTIDADHCLHVSGNMHAVPMVYFKTQTPYDISSFEPIFPLVSSEDEQRCTYPKFMKNKSGHLIYAYRKGGSGNGITIMNQYDEKTKSFKRLTDQPLFDGLGEMNAYQSGPTLGPDNQYHVTWVWRNTPHCETNHDVSYATSDDLVHWQPLSGQNSEVSILPRHSQFVVDPVAPKGGAINGGFTLFFDGENNPLIAYMKYDASGYSQIYIAYGKDGQWHSNQISQWDYRWEFSGPGSINFDIRLHRAKFSTNGNIVISYEHIKRGTGELHVDPQTMTLIEDHTIKQNNALPYPEALLNPMSSIEGMSVRWMSIQSPDKKSKATYALRWETLGKRRFYEPVENAVEPSPLVLYKFA